jgi:hypothetical protein
VDLQLIVEELAETYAQVWYYVTDATHNGVMGARKRLSESLAERVFVYRAPSEENEDEDEEEA